MPTINIRVNEKLKSDDKKLFAKFSLNLRFCRLVAFKHLT